MAPVIELHAVHRTYASGEAEVHAVRGVSLSIARGECVAIMGASGGGKSTLMNLLGCLDRPTHGQYWLDGVDVSSLNADALADLRNSKLGFVFQGFCLLPRTTALENVELPMQISQRKLTATEIRARALHSLERVGLAARANHYPNELSGGQQQRVAIARALVNEPQVILADEPTGNLDTRTSIQIMRLFQEVNDAGITIVMVTHEPDIARYCKRNLMMRDGQVVRDAQVTERQIAAQVEQCLEKEEVVRLSA